MYQHHAVPQVALVQGRAEEILPAHQVRKCILKVVLYGATSTVQIEHGWGWQAGELCEQVRAQHSWESRKGFNCLWH